MGDRMVLSFARRLWESFPGPKVGADSIPTKSPWDETISRGSACIGMKKNHIITHVKDPVGVHVRVRWITETQT